LRYGQVIFYGIPCAGTLVAELFAAATIGRPVKGGRTRVDLIQDLSVFIGYLEWLAPIGHHAQLICGRASKRLSQTLSDALNIHFNNTKTPEDRTDQAQWMNVADFPDAFMSGSEINWIDEMDWSDFAFTMTM
jgi:hypothetical protein